MTGPPPEMPLRETKFAPSELYVSSRIHLRHHVLVPTCSIYLRSILPEWLQSKMWFVDSWLMDGDFFPPLFLRKRGLDCR